VSQRGTSTSAIAPWPGIAWPHAAPAPGVDTAQLSAVLDTLLAQRPEHGDTHAVVVVHRGAVVAERYGPGRDASSTSQSWSIAKSFTHALVGFVVADGLLELDAPAPVPEWQDDERRRITTQHLLNMRDGLDFNEEYVELGESHVFDMLWGAGKDDVAGYAAARSLRHQPATTFNYSSGTTNVISRIVAEVARRDGEDRAAASRRLLARLFEPLGMATATADLDATGTFVGSSCVFATPRDFARFGYLYLRDGVWGGVRLLPEGWVDHARAHTADDPDTGFGFGAHWWLWPSHPDVFAAHGFEGQYVLVSPARDLVITRFGKTPRALRPNLIAELGRLIDAFPRSSVPADAGG
jgi:CubicO group peptidase (beta-lactamase class C family)